PQRLDAGLDLPGLGLCLADLQVDLRVSLLGSEFLKPGVDLVELGDRAVDVRVDLDGLVRKGPADVTAKTGGVLPGTLLLEQHLNIRRPVLESALCHQRAFRTSKTSGNAIAEAATDFADDSRTVDVAGVTAAWRSAGTRGSSTGCCARIRIEITPSYTPIRQANRMNRGPSS